MPLRVGLHHGEGQMYMGGLAGSHCGYHIRICRDMSRYHSCSLASMLVGMIWALPDSGCYYGSSEVVLHDAELCVAMYLTDYWY